MVEKIVDGRVTLLIEKVFDQIFEKNPKINEQFEKLHEKISLA